jgi:hypothetical protein
MLHFGSKQLFWECSEMRVCDSCPAYLLPPIDFASLSKLRVPSDDENAITALLGYHRWYRIVSEYTSKGLTMAEDKLAALSGVSRQHQELMLNDDDEYLAGIWRSDLPGNLCWTVEASAGGDLKNSGYPAGKPKDRLVDFANDLQVLGIHGWVHLAPGMGRRATGL